MAMKAENGCARRQRFEKYLSPWVIEHRLRQKGRVAVEALQFEPRDAPAKPDAAVVRHVFLAAFVADDGQREVRPLAARTEKSVDEELAAFRPEEMLCDEEQIRLRVGSWRKIGIDLPHAGTNRCHPVRWNTIMRDDLVAYIAPKSENVLEAEERLAFQPLIFIARLVAEASGIRPPRQRQ